MADNISNALLLMLIGMLTVFVILSIVVLSGRLLIRIINSFTEKSKKDHNIPPEHIAVISAITENLTDGKAHEIKIDKL